MGKISTVAVLLLVMSAMAGVAAAKDATANVGVVWAVNSTGDRSDYFSLGTRIYIDGENFNANVRYGWTITDQDKEGADKPIVAQNSTILYTDDITGKINRVDTEWNIPSDDYQSHDYRLNVQIYEPRCNPYKKCCKEFYTKKDTFYSVPEFPTIALPMLSILGLMFVLSRKRK